MTKHIVIGIPADIWPEMKAEYERLSGKCRIVIARYRGRPIVEAVITNYGHIQLVATLS